MNLYGELTPIQKLKKARVKLNETKPFFGYLTMRLNFIEKNDMPMPSMGVDRYGNCYYDIEFVKSLNQEEVNATLCHEVCHCAFGHLERQEGKDHQLLNISQDAVINALLIKDGMSLPKGCILPNSSGTLELMDVKIPDVHKKSHQEVYDRLYNAWKKQQKENKLGMSGQVLDNHMRGNDKDGSGNSNGKDKKDNKKNGFGNGSKQEEINWEKELVEASTFAKMQGNLPAGIKRIVDDLLGNSISWRELLYKYITNTLPFDYTWMRPNKKSYATGVYMPEIVREQIDIIVSIDTSGSISPKELLKFSSELLGIINSFDNVKLTIIYNDTEVYGPHRLTNPTPDDIKRLKPEGGGGTDHRPVFEWVDKNMETAKLLICFTDGYTSFPRGSALDTIWVLAGYHCNKDNIPFGRVIELPKEE